MQLAVRSTAISPDLRVALTSGFIGGLTTYSSFNWEATRLFQDGAKGMAVVYVAVTLVGCLAAGWLGFMLARRI